MQSRKDNSNFNSPVIMAEQIVSLKNGDSDRVGGSQNETMSGVSSVGASLSLDLGKSDRGRTRNDGGTLSLREARR